MKKALGSAPFDSDGVATRARDIVHNGILEGYVLSAYSARKLGMQTTGNAGGVHNLIIEHGNLDLEGLISKMGTGLLITDMIGFGVNQVTGDYSRGASGFWIEDGKKVQSVEGVTVSSNFFDLLKGIRGISNSYSDTVSSVKVPDVLVESVYVAG